MTHIIYVIDNEDRIVSVSDQWLPFAEENQAAESCGADKVINESIWTFVDGYETKHLYEIIMKNVRTNNAPVTLPFRCDAPDRRRYLELTISHLPQGWLEFASCLLREDARDPVGLLATGVSRSDDFIKMCSMCKKVEVAEQRWEETEAAVITLKLFEQELLPAISHGLCPDCYAVSMVEVEKLHGKAPDT